MPRQDVNAELAAREVTQHVAAESTMRAQPEPRSEGIQEPQAGIQESFGIDVADVCFHKVQENL